MRAGVLTGSAMAVVEPHRVVFVGWGSIARATVRLLGDAPIVVVAVAKWSETPVPPDLPAGARLLREFEAVRPVLSDSGYTLPGMAGFHQFQTVPISISAQLLITFGNLRLQSIAIAQLLIAIGNLRLELHT